MKLLIIVLCLLSERYLQHTLANKRFNWFNDYSKAIEKQLSHLSLTNSWLLCALVILPILVAALIFFHLFSTIFYGTFNFIFSLIIFYYCLGSHNVFYPVRKLANEENNISDVGGYLVEVNGQLFAVIFWFIVLGPMGALLYRLLSLCQAQGAMHEAASLMTDLLDWLPARLTALLYLLAGNFKDGFEHYSKLFFSSIKKNKLLLSHCGLNALGQVKEPSGLLPEAERLVEHSVILLLVLLALVTMATFASL